MKRFILIGLWMTNILFSMGLVGYAQPSESERIDQFTAPAIPVKVVKSRSIP